MPKDNQKTENSSLLVTKIARLQKPLSYYILPELTERRGEGTNNKKGKKEKEKREDFDLWSLCDSNYSQRTLSQVLSQIEAIKAAQH
jgi:hypothetical protein